MLLSDLYFSPILAFPPNCIVIPGDNIAMPTSLDVYASTGLYNMSSFRMDEFSGNFSRMILSSNVLSEFCFG